MRVGKLRYVGSKENKGYSKITTTTTATEKDRSKFFRLSWPVVLWIQENKSGYCSKENSKLLKSLFYSYHYFDNNNNYYYDNFIINYSYYYYGIIVVWGPPHAQVLLLILCSRNHSWQADRLNGVPGKGVDGKWNGRSWTRVRQSKSPTCSSNIWL